MKPMRAEQELVQLAAPAKDGPPAEMIFGDWYPAVRAESLGKGETAVTTLLGIPMLLGRKSDGSAVCHARSVSASRDSVVRGLVRWGNGAVQISRLAV